MNAAVAERTISPALEQLFADLANKRLFVIYKLMPRAEGRTDKVPVGPMSGRPVDAQSEANRMLPAEASLWYQLGTGDGVGIVITPESRLWFLDLDKCREPEGWQPHVAWFLAQFPGCYRETSASTAGRHALGRYSGAAPAHGTRNADYRAELYTAARFCALTGLDAEGSILSDHTTALVAVAAQFFPARAEHGDVEWSDKPVAEWRGPADDAELIARARRSITAESAFGRGASFDALWRGDADVLGRAFPPQNGHDAWDRSSADLALANALAFWSGKDCARMERIMRSNDVHVRPKWDRPDGYLRSTILRACAGTANVYQGRTTGAPVNVPAGTQAPGAPAPPGVELVRAADITPEPIRWLWHGWLPSGKLVILAGIAGTGKSTIAFTIAATVSRGGNWPDATVYAGSGNVIIWSGEDDAADTIVPRLMAAGADLTRVHIVRGKLGLDGKRVLFDPATDLPQLEQRIEAINGAAMLIVDPIVSAVAGDMHKASEVRRSLQALVGLGEKFDCAVIGISHFRKGSQGTSPQERVIGSQAFGALARLVLVAAESEEDGRRVLARAKSNISVDRGGYEYAIVPHVVAGNISTTRIEWKGLIQGSAREILKDAERESETEDTSECARALVSALRDPNGRNVAVEKRLLETQLKQAGYSQKQIRRAREKLKIVTWVEGFGVACKGMWKLPDSIGNGQ